jgi:hypothetical protein
MDLVDLAGLEKAKESKKKKKQTNMSDAVNSTEKIRTWVSQLTILSFALIRL